MLRDFFLLFCLLYFTGASVRAGEPFVMFASAWDFAAVEYVLGRLDSDDYVSHSVARSADKSGKLRARTFSLPPNLSGVQRGITHPCGDGNGRNLVIYDPEHWEHTPPEERDNLGGSLDKAKALIGTNGCMDVGFAPDGKMVGVIPKLCQGSPGEFVSSVNWNGVHVFVIQAQGLLSNRCGGEKNINRYAEFIEKWVSILKKANPKVKIVSSMSFNYTRPDVMVAAVRQTRGLVDGYYLAYPARGGGTGCKYCSSENLSIVVESIKERR
jgi:hypothetical protein